jgi:hypothetical protein
MKKIFSKLINCIECGHSIAPSALSCPKCKSDSPHGVSCEVCDEKINKKHAITFVIAGQRNTVFYYHYECIKTILSVPSGIQCSDCGHQLDTSILPIDAMSANETPCNFYDSNFLPSCPECGSLNVLQREGFCSLCKMPIYKFHQLEEGLNEQYPQPFSNNLLFHKYCIKNTSKKWVLESVEKNRTKQPLFSTFRLKRIIYSRS